MNVFATLSFIAFMLCFFMGNFIYHKNSDSSLNKMVAVLCILVGFLAFVEFEYRQVVDFQTAYFWLKISGLWPLVPAILLHISLIFTEKKKILRNKLTYIAIYAPALIISIFAINTPMMLEGILKEYWGWTYVFPKNSLLFGLMSIWTIICTIISGTLCFLHYLKSHHIERMHAKYMLAGLYLPLLVSFSSDFVFPTVSVRVPEMTMAMSTLGITFISYGIWKYGFPALTAASVADEIVSTMSNFLILLDSQKNIITVNKATCNLLGYDKNELEGFSVGKIFADENQERLIFIGDYLNAKRGPNSMNMELNFVNNFELNLKSKNGFKIPVIISKSFIKNEEGLIVGIILIGNDIRDIKSIEDKIESALEEKELLLQEVHHRVKNNLQIISSLLSLQSNYIKEPEDLEIFQNSQNRVKSLALIHEKLYQSPNFTHINFEDYIWSLMSYLLGYYKPNSIKLEIDVKDIFMGIDTAVPCGLIINELATNSIKHAFPNSMPGTIKIGLYYNNSEFELVVRDDGIGFQEAINFETTENLGLRLVSALTQQINGTIKLNRINGTEFRVKFHEVEYAKRI
ncbi:histidine kinase dimerization/phosphoacceptor domain -containing protein [Methanobacterium aggregans]|uniref:histidine kinase dimerization/phosphoacceptor domain -containing protein n=1 Tax=Methanobacterium aggregans TaxID=1615586 RepID=UPI001AE7846E|nr:histidine kinase dimerization/phosphoacceptor domain -containing protein [Methanobacterium aggregans]MBP2045377.1 PAS domain S-box-containing protein [Methanobacterium aggregans]